MGGKSGQKKRFAGGGGAVPLIGRRSGKPRLHPERKKMTGGKIGGFSPKKEHIMRRRKPAKDLRTRSEKINAKRVSREK